MYMRTMRALNCAVLALLTVVASPCMAATRSGNDDVGSEIVRSAGIDRASDIRSVVFYSPYECTYKFDRADHPELAKELFEALRSSQRCLTTMIPYGGRIIVDLENGRTVWFPFGHTYVTPQHPVPLVIIDRKFCSPDLGSLLLKVQKDLNAAKAGAGIERVEIAGLTVTIPRDAETLAPIAARLPIESPEAKAVADSAWTIIDWLDVRGGNAQKITDEGLSAAIGKFGAVVLALQRPMALRFHVAQGEERQYGSGKPSEAPRHDLTGVSVRCNAVTVMDYGNYTPPVVVLDCGSGGHYLFTSLNRRDQEKFGVGEFGWPGHPQSDTSYYRRPGVLFRELRELVKKATDRWHPNGSTDGRSK